MNAKNQISIFIVDDNKVFRLALKADIEATFKNIPITIYSFETGEACMKEFNQKQPQVIILDYNLNSMFQKAANGIQVLGWIKKENEEANVIMLTSIDDIEIALKAFHHGASDYVVKTETKFKKINYSLFNLFKMIQAKNDAKKYKYLSIGLSLCITFLIGAVVAIQILEPSLLK